VQLARDLKREAERSDERRLLVFTGRAAATDSAATSAVATADIDPDDVIELGGGSNARWETLDPKQASHLLGTTHEAVVVDAHDSFRPNALGRAVGAVGGGGLLVVRTPPLDRWPDHRDGFDESLAVPPFDVADVTDHFRSRIVDLLGAHPGIAVAAVGDDGAVETIHRDGLTDPAPRLPADTSVTPTGREHDLPTAVVDRCYTSDQIDAVATLSTLDTPKTAVVVEADRGRGKSSAAGLAAGALTADGRDVLVTAPEYRNAAEVFARADEYLAAEGLLAARDDEPPRWLETDAGSIRFERPATAADLPGTPDAVIVDEAAALPVGLLERLLDAPAVAFTTTVRGYEGAGRGFSVRFRDRLADSDHAVTRLRIDEPIRYAAGDPVEVWAFRALLLDASPAVAPLVNDATPETATYRRIDAADLLADEHLLREVFGLLVHAHYRTEPNDLARLLDAPNVSVRALTHDGHVVSVALLAREGDLPADLRAHMYEGGRVRGNMLPDVLTSQLRDEAAAIPVGQRVLRIGTHPAVRSRGLGSTLLDHIHTEFAPEVDWLGTGYGATPALLDFWTDNGFRTVHLSTTRNESSGEYSAIMLRPTSEAGEELLARHTEWFTDRIEAVLADPLSDLDPDIIRAALRSVATAPELDLTDWQWRLLAGIPDGASILDTDPGPLGRLTVRYLTETPPPSESAATRSDRLTAREERLLVRKAVQGHPWGAVAEGLGFVSRAECMRALGAAVRPLVSRYGDETAQTERERFE